MQFDLSVLVILVSNMLRHYSIKSFPNNDKSRCVHLTDSKAIIYFKNANSASKENVQELP